MYLASTWKSEWVMQAFGIFVCLRMFQKVEEQWLAEKRVNREVDKSFRDRYPDRGGE